MQIPFSFSSYSSRLRGSGCRRHYAASYETISAESEVSETVDELLAAQAQPDLNSQRPLRVYFSAGEPSGDLHGANLIREFRAQHPNFEAMGYGGSEMASAGCQLHADLTALAVMWFLRVLLNLHKFLALAGRADRYFRHHKPDAVVLIDFPGFNWWIARRAKAHGIPVYYYAPPQIWAWASWRVKKMRRFVDHVLCALPFEARWLAERGCQATYVGHPFFDEVRRQTLDQEFVVAQRDATGPLVVILPGSRTQEVEHNAKFLLRAAHHVHRKVPRARFAVAAFSAKHAEMVRAMADGQGLPLEIHVRRTPELIHLAECCLAVSGSVSLELLHQEKPTAILYWISPLAYFVQRQFRHTKYITLVNLLASDDPCQWPGADSVRQGAEALFPEYLTCQDVSEQLAGHAVGWLTDGEARTQLVSRLAGLKQQIGQGGAARQAVATILGELARRVPAEPRPHYLPQRPAASASSSAPAATAKSAA